MSEDSFFERKMDLADRYSAMLDEEAESLAIDMMRGPEKNQRAGEFWPWGEGAMSEALSEISGENIRQISQLVTSGERDAAARMLLEQIEDYWYQLALEEGRHRASLQWRG
jgi:hypothetical protein